MIEPLYIHARFYENKFIALVKSYYHFQRIV